MAKFLDKAGVEHLWLRMREFVRNYVAEKQRPIVVIEGDVPNVPAKGEATAYITEETVAQINPSVSLNECVPIAFAQKMADGNYAYGQVYSGISSGASHYTLTYPQLTWDGTQLCIKVFNSLENAKATISYVVVLMKIM